MAGRTDPGSDPREPAAPGFALPPDAPEPLGNGPGGYGRRVLRERTPTLITEVRDRHPYGPGQRRALDALREEIASGAMRPLGEGAPDRARWDRWGAAYFGRPWADVPFLWWESYFYRRLLEAVEFFTPGPWFWVDPFEYWKTAELRDATVAVPAHRRPAADERQALLPASLWGNQADLGFLFGAAGGPAASGGLVADDGALVWSALDAGGPDHVAVVADNAGRELLADLLLIDHLLRTGLAATVTLHLKPHPYYVSDATTADLVACLRRLAAADGEAAAVERRLSEAIGTGRLRLRAHAFFCAPWSYHHMPADLAEEFGGHTLTIMKGDLNYRRLVGDLAWPPTTPFAEVTAYFPGPVAALRTLKSDVVTGVDAATLSSLDASGGDWRTSGTHGLIQARVST